MISRQNAEDFISWLEELGVNVVFPEDKIDHLTKSTPIYIKQAIEDVKYILEHGHPVVGPSLLANIVTFKLTIQQDKELASQREREQENQARLKTYDEKLARLEKAVSENAKENAHLKHEIKKRDNLEDCSQLQGENCPAKINKVG